MELSKIISSKIIIQELIKSNILVKVKLTRRLFEGVTLMLVLIVTNVSILSFNSHIVLYPIVLSINDEINN